MPTGTQLLLICSILGVIMIIALRGYEYSFRNYEYLITETAQSRNHTIPQWNNIQTIRRKFRDYFINSVIKYYEEPILTNITYQYFNYSQLMKCYANKWIIFNGDSRLRYSYADWIKIANNSILSDPFYPRNSKCPYINITECAVWFKGKDCEYDNCVRDWHSPNLETGRWTFNSAGTSKVYKNMITPSNKPHLVFVEEGAWNVYGLYNVYMRNQSLQNTTFEVTWNEYETIFKHLIKIFDKIENRIDHEDTIKIWMAYPECNLTINENTKYTHVLNQFMRSYITNNDTLIQHNWVFFQIPTPSVSDYCEGFHVRDKWTLVENQLITNALCG